MDLEQALRVFGIDRSSNISDLNVSFRRLVKKYHPDYNAERADWSHAQMIKLNQAYQLARAALLSTAKPRGPGEHNRERLREKLQQRYRRVNEVFAEEYEAVEEAVFDYYQHGLHNLHLRKEGNRSLRFRSVYRRLSKSVPRLDRLAEACVTQTQYDTISAFRNFGRSFLDNAQLDRVYLTSSDRATARAYQHYNHGAELLDTAIKEHFFSKLLRMPTNRSVTELLGAAESEFLLLITRYNRSSWLTEAAVKLCLLDAVSKLSQLRADRGRAP